MNDFERRLAQGLSDAVRHFWAVRGRQHESQGASSGRKDTGSRSAVTGGKHGDGFVALIASVIREAGIADADVYTRRTTLPCYFRPSKDWDLVVKSGDDLIAVIEVNAHVGSFGNNFNTRAEEALGSATDFWAAYREATFKPSARPWLGYLMMLEDAPGSVRQGQIKSLPHYSSRPEFLGASYAKRYEIFCERLVREKLYDSASLVMSGASGGLQGIYKEPNAELAFRNFAAGLHARAATYAKIQAD